MKVNGQWVLCVHNSSYSSILILQKLYRILTHFSQFELSRFSCINDFYNESEWTVGTLCAQLLLQFYSDYFETLQMSWPCFEDVHVV